MKVAIDAGHGGEDSGALGPNGLREAEVTLDLARRVASFLESKGLEAVLTRRSDSFVTLKKRAKLANEAAADVFLSIHCNAFQGRARGYECFTSRGPTTADRLAADLLAEFERYFPGLRNRGAKEAGFSVLNRTTMPAALFEVEFIDHPDGEAFLAKETNRQVIAKALAMGVCRFLGHAPHPPVMDPWKRRVIEALETLLADLRSS